MFFGTQTSRDRAPLDVNVLVALAWPNHVHHRTARQWFDAEAQRGWATCPLSQSGFVRVSANPRIIPDAVQPKEALELLRRMALRGNHAFWPDDVDIAVAPEIADMLVVGPKQVTDACLLALAIRRGGRLVTVDRAVRNLLPMNSPHHSAVESILANADDG